MAEFMSEDGMPETPALARLLGVDRAVLLGPLIGEALLRPARDLMGRPSKQVRARLVRIGFELAKDKKGDSRDGDDALSVCARAIELLHAGSLIVDDIQDGSDFRRGATSLHLRFGVAGALCTGNWLYFWPLGIIRELGLPVERENLAFRLYHDALERAHYGQALDLSVKIDEVPRADVKPICESVMELKTGSVTALAMTLGAVIAGAEETRVRRLGAFGTVFGKMLQRCDDVGNVLGVAEPRKRFEDLLQRKPSGIWAQAADGVDDGVFEEFRALARRLPETGGDLIAWLDAHGGAARALASTEAELQSAVAALVGDLQLDADHPDVASLRGLGDQVLHAYI